jgi:hypothetical protein
MTQVCQSAREASSCVIELNGDAFQQALLVQHILVIALDKPEHHRSRERESLSFSCVRESLFRVRPPASGFRVWVSG